MTFNEPKWDESPLFLSPLGLTLLGRVSEERFRNESRHFSCVCPGSSCSILKQSNFVIYFQIHFKFKYFLNTSKTIWNLTSTKLTIADKRCTLSSSWRSWTVWCNFRTAWRKNLNKLNNFERIKTQEIIWLQGVWIGLRKCWSWISCESNVSDEKSNGILIQLQYLENFPLNNCSSLQKIQIEVAAKWFPTPELLGGTKVQINYFISELKKWIVCEKEKKYNSSKSSIGECH